MFDNSDCCKEPRQVPEPIVLPMDIQPFLHNDIHTRRL